MYQRPDQIPKQRPDQRAMSLGFPTHTHLHWLVAVRWCDPARQQSAGLDLLGHVTQEVGWSENRVKDWEQTGARTCIPTNSFL